MKMTNLFNIASIIFKSILNIISRSYAIFSHKVFRQLGPRLLDGNLESIDFGVKSIFSGLLQNLPHRII